MTENHDRDEMQKLLAYANFSKVAEAVGVKRAAVANWAAGRHVTPARLEQVRALYGLPVTSGGQQKEAAPIGERLDELLVLVRAIAEATPGVDLARLGDIHRRVLELERARQRPDAQRRSEDQATRDSGTSIGQ